MNWRSAIISAFVLGVAAGGLSAWLGPRQQVAEPRVSHWNGLSAERRGALLAQYELLVSESRLRNVEEQAAELRRLSAADRQRLDWLTGQVNAALARLSPTQRASIRELPPPAQAVQLYHLLDNVDPALLDRLARDWRGMS